MMRRLVFPQHGLARRGLLAVGISLVAVAVLAAVEWLVLRRLGLKPLAEGERFSVLQYCPPREAGWGLLVYWNSSNKPNSSMRHGLELYEGSLGEKRQAFSWKELTPRGAVWAGEKGLVAISSQERTIYDTSQRPARSAANNMAPPACVPNDRGATWRLDASQVLGECRRAWLRNDGRPSRFA
jgi:hypothetical protein